MVAKRSTSSWPQAATLHDRLVEVLVRYVSRITVSSMLATVLAERTMTAEAMTADDLVDIVDEVMIGVRLFCPPERLGDLMADLAAFCDRETWLANGTPSQRQVSLQHVG